jgi:hypothetical protein
MRVYIAALATNKNGSSWIEEKDKPTKKLTIVDSFLWA